MNLRQLEILRAVESLADPALAALESLLWRLACDAARTHAREAVAAQLQASAPDLAPARIEAPAAPPVLLLNVAPGNENHAPPVVLDIPAPDPAILAA